MSSVVISERGLELGTRTELEVTLLEYRTALRQADVSLATVRAYHWHLDRLLVWLAERGVVSLRQVSRVMLREWGAGLYDHWQTATIKQAIGATRSFFKWCWQERLIVDNPAEALKCPREKCRIQRTVTPEEISVLIDGCDLATLKGIRDRAIISLLFDSGLRAAELCRLRVVDVSLEAQELKVVIKGGDEGKGWFGKTTREYLEAWLAVRLGWRQVETLFVAIGGTRVGYPLTTDGLRVILRKHGDRCGVERLSAHAFRRGFAVCLSMAGVPDNILKDLGRWRDVKMVKRYTAAQQAGLIYQQYAPMDRLEQEP